MRGFLALPFSRRVGSCMTTMVSDSDPKHAMTFHVVIARTSSGYTMPSARFSAMVVLILKGPSTPTPAASVPMSTSSDST